jgi:hypothetical protein
VKVTVTLNKKEVEMALIKYVHDMTQNEFGDMNAKIKQSLYVDEVDVELEYADGLLRRDGEEVES